MSHALASYETTHAYRAAEPAVEPSALRKLPSPARKIEAVADRARPAYARLFLSSFVAARERVDVSLLTMLLQSGGAARVEEFMMGAVDASQDALLRAAAASTTSRLLLTTMQQAANAVRLPAWAFDVTNPLAVAWAEQHAAELVTAVTEETRDAIRLTIVRTFDEQIDVRTAANMLRDGVGMTQAQANAVLNLRRTILENPGRRLYAGRTPIRVPAEGMPASRLDAVLQSYADRLTRQRAVNIARTETIAASNQGQTELWRQAIANRQLPSDVKRVWIAAPSERTCDQCLGLDGVEATMDETFDGIANPPAHPMCRCSTGLVR